MILENILRWEVRNVGKLLILYLEESGLPEQRKVLKQNQEVSLTNIEFCILYVLALHQGSILSKEQIYYFVWNGEYGLIKISLTE